MFYPLVKFYGGKHYIKRWIIDSFPADYTARIYCEPFIGGGSIFLNKKASAVEIISDVYEPLVELWQVVRDNPAELQAKLNSIQYNESVFNVAVNNYDKAIDTIERAIFTFCKYRMSRVGLGKDFCTTTRFRRGKLEHLAAWESAINQIDKISKRLDGANILLGDFRKVFDIVGRLATQKLINVLMYLDPPYFHSSRSTNKCYQYEMVDKDHEDLLDIITSLPPNYAIVLSGYDNHLYSGILKNWNRRSKIFSSRAGQTNKKINKEEVLWTNF